MAVEVAGPFRGHFFCKVPPETTLGVNSKEYSLLDHPLGKESKDFTASGKDRFVFIKVKGQNGRSDKLNLVVNGKEQTLQADINKAAILQLQEIYGKLQQLGTAPEAEQRSPQGGAETDTQPEGKELQTKDPKDPDPADEVGEMISEAEDEVYKTAKERLARLTELHAMEVRQVHPSSRSDAGLLRRYKREHKEGQQKELLDQCKVMQKDLQKELETTTNPKECLISLESSFQETKDVLEGDKTIEELSQMESVPWERLFGLVGIPVSHKVQLDSTRLNYTDPMNIGINENLNEVVSSSEFPLNQKSLWSLSGSNGIRSLDDIAQEWGFKNKVTAVVPIKSWNHPTVWKAYHKGPLSSMVTSSQLRGAHIPMQQDEQAFTAATLLRTVTDWAAPNETQAKLMADLLDTIQFTDPRALGVPAPITEFIEETEMHIVNNMPSALAPMAKMLESKFVLSFAGTQESSEFWKAIVSNSIYWKVRRAIVGRKRDDVLRSLANFMERSINKEVLSSFNEDLTVYARMFRIAQNYNSLGKIDHSLFGIDHENIEEFKKFITHFDYDVFLLAEVVRALICCGKVTKKLKYPNHDTEEGNWQWMQEELERRDELGSDQLEAREAWEGFLQEAPEQPLQKFADDLTKAIPNEFETIRTVGGKKKHNFKVEEIFDRLTNATTVQTEEKLKLILFGKSSGGITWGNGEGLKNGQIAKKILDFLTTLSNFKVDKDYEKMIDKTNQYTKHWYRQQGSRKKYTNERPSFWAITEYSTPWAFFKKNKEGYKIFKVNLQDLEGENDMAKKNFYQDWKHLLEKDPTKKFPLATARPPRVTRPETEAESLVSWENGPQLLSIFPHPRNTTFGLESLMKASGISAEDLKIDQEKLPEAATKIASNWETILSRMLPREQAQEQVHSLKEVFGIDENLFKAFNAYQVLKRVPDLAQRKDELIKVLSDASEKTNEGCFLDQDNQDRSSDIHIPDARIKVFEKYSIRILERLLPLRAVKLTKAIETLFKKDQIRTMGATYHVLQRYMDYGVTSMDALMKLLMDEKLIHSTEDLLVGSEQLELVHPAVSFELKYDENGEKTEDNIKKSLQNTLDAFMRDENAVLWMNQEYERSRREYNWEPLEVTTDDLKTVSVSVDAVWFGSNAHVKVTVEFNYETFDSSPGVAKQQKKRMHQLRDFFQLVLENVYQLAPITEEFKKSGGSWQSNRIPEGDDYEKYEYKRVTQVFKGLKSSATAREETASIFKSLGEKGAKYNEAKNILELLNSEADVDNLTIRVSRARPGFRVNQIICGPVFIRAEKKTRLKELPEMILNKINELMKRELLSGALKNKYEEVFDTLINLNDPALFGHKKRIELAPQIAQYKSTPQSMISIIVEHLRDEGRTLGDLGDAFAAIEKSFSDKKSKKATKALKEGLDVIVREATELSDKEAEKQFAKDRSLGTFLNFLKDHQPDGIKKYARARGFRKDHFLQLANDKKIVVGDMICFWRKNMGIEYAHAGIYAPVEGKKYVVHVQAEAGWLRSMKGCSEVKCDELENVIAKDDRLFFIRECEDCTAQAEVLSKVEACLFTDPIKYTYNGYYGSCQTFCSKVLGSSLFEELNPEAFLTTQTGLKWIASRFLGGEHNADELVNEMEKRFETPPSWIESWTPPDLPHGESLITTCPRQSRLAIQGRVETNCRSLSQTEGRPAVEELTDEMRRSTL